jgi:dihydrofolate reductase
MKISIIAAIGRNRELGKDNKLIWNIQEDLQRFRKITKGHPIIMGRKTFESIGRVLPNRTNIIITRNLSFSFARPGLAKLAGSLEDAIKLAQKEKGSEEIFIIGGGQIYQQAISLADKLYLTIINASFDADTFFPDYSDFKKVVFEEEREPALNLASRRSGRRGRSKEYKYKFLELER